MVEDSLLLIVECVEQLLNDLGSSQPRRSRLAELRRKLANTALFLARALDELGLDDTVGDRFTDLIDDVGETLDATRVLGDQPPSELKLSLFLVASSRRWLFPSVVCLALPKGQCALFLRFWVFEGGTWRATR